MRVKKVQIAVLAVLASAVTMTSTATADGWFKDMDDAKEVNLGEVLRNPHAYIDVELRVKLYFNSTGGAYNPYFTRFTEETYGNFAAWPIDARLYEKRDYQRSYNYFFVNRTNEQWKEIQALERVTAVEVGATVREVFKGQPWIEVFEVRELDEGLDESAVRNAVAGNAYYLAGQYDEAVRRYERAVRNRLPGNTRADLYRKLGDAHYHAEHYDDAADAYRRALRAEPDSAVLKRGLAAAEGAYARSRGRDGGEWIEPAPHTEPVTSRSSDVDAIIELMEDPAAVEAEVEAWRVELEKRAARARYGSADVTPVGGEHIIEHDAHADDVDETAGDVSDDTGADAGTEGAPNTEPDANAGTDAEVEKAPIVEEPGSETEAPIVEEPGSETEAPAEAEDAGVTDDTEIPAETDADDDTDYGVEDDTDSSTPEGCGEAGKPADDGSPETAADGCGEDVKDATADDETSAEDETSTDGCGTEWTEDDGCATDVPADSSGCGEAEWTDEPTDGCGTEWTEDAEGCGEAEWTDDATAGCGDETVDDWSADEDPRVVTVGEIRVSVPRLPFFGCEEVTQDELRAVVAEIVRNPER